MLEEVHDAAIGQPRAKGHISNRARRGRIRTGEFGTFAEAVRRVLHVLLATCELIDRDAVDLGHQADFRERPISYHRPSWQPVVCRLAVVAEVRLSPSLRIHLVHGEELWVSPHGGVAVFQVVTFAPTAWVIRELFCRTGFLTRACRGTHDGEVGAQRPDHVDRLLPVGVQREPIGILDLLACHGIQNRHLDLLEGRHRHEVVLTHVSQAKAALDALGAIREGIDQGFRAHLEVGIAVCPALDDVDAGNRVAAARSGKLLGQIRIARVHPTNHRSANVRVFRVIVA